MSSAQYRQFFQNMGRHIEIIAEGIKDLPANVAASVTSIQTTPSSSSKQSSSISEPTVELLPQLDHRKFPKVTHWDKRGYLEKRKQGTGKAKEEEDDLSPNPNTDLGGPEASASGLKLDVKTSTISAYMEDEDGKEIPEDERTAARTKARSFWIMLWNEKKAPPSFRSAEIGIKDRFILLMEKSYPWLRLCSNHWKATQIWSNHYSPWYGSMLKEEAAAKAAAEGRVIDVDADSDNAQDGPEMPSKRPQLDGETSDAKRRRLGEVSSAPSSHPAHT
jgi:hypothetical protein